MSDQKHSAPTWDEFFDEVSNRDWLAARAVLEVDPSQKVKRDACGWLSYHEYAGRPDAAGIWRPEAQLDWDAWVADVEERGRGWSSTEWRMFDLAAGLTTGKPFNIVGTLDEMGSWTVGVWTVLIGWGTGCDMKSLSRDAPSLRR